MKTKQLAYRGMTVFEGARHVRDRLTLKQMAYASAKSRGKYRGFAALHDVCDANMLLPFSEDFRPTAKQIEFYNAVMQYLTAWLIADYEAGLI
jgi:hypothetical protein